MFWFHSSHNVHRSWNRVTGCVPSFHVTIIKNIVRSQDCNCWQVPFKKFELDVLFAKFTIIAKVRYWNVYIAGHKTSSWISSILNNHKSSAYYRQKQYCLYLILLPIAFVIYFHTIIWYFCIWNCENISVILNGRWCLPVHVPANKTLFTGTPSWYVAFYCSS